MTTIETMLATTKAGFLRIAEKHQLVRWEEECQFARQAIETSARLQGCTATSIQDAIINVAAIGLTLNPAHGYAYLVPESVKVGENNWVNQCHLRVSFKGLIKLANDSGVAEWVKADVVKAKDTFIFNGAWALPEHQMEPFKDRGKSVGVFCTIKTRSGEYLTETAPWSEVMKAKGAAKTKNVWDLWEDEMAKKFIIKRASKQWPKGANFEHLSQAIHAIDQYEGSVELRKYDEIAGHIQMIMADELSDRDKASLFVEAWGELTDEEKQEIWAAKTKGGWFSAEEKAEIHRLQSVAREEGLYEREAENGAN